MGGCIQLGRRFSRSGNQADLHEALRLLGTGLHCLEDYAAHSNYTELSLIELGERDIFPHVGRRVLVQLRGANHPVYPIVNGTFGGVDFLHSVMGEFSDKATQSEIQSLQGVIQQSQNEAPSESFIQDLLNKVPAGIFGNDDNTDKMDEFQSNAEAAKRKGQNISPRQPEEWAQYVNDVQRQIYPVLEWHDNLLKSINQAIESIPMLPELIEQIQEQITVFAFSILAPSVIPIISQVKRELETGSSEVIQSSRDKQHIVFNDDNCSDPTHSMLSKDHFSNVLNEPAGKVAQQVVKWVVPQIMECWDNERIDADRTLNRIIQGVFHHPALRDYGDDGAVDVRRLMFRVVEQWWSDQGDRGHSSLRRQLSREGVLNGENHKPGVHDSGHGCGKPMTMPGRKSGSSSGILGSLSGSGALGGRSDSTGILGGLVEGFVGGAGSEIFEGAFGGAGGNEPYKESKYKDKEDKKYEDKKYKEEKKYKEDKEDKRYKEEKMYKEEKKYKDDDDDKRYKEEKKYKEKKYKDDDDYDKRHKEEKKYKEKKYKDDDDDKKYKEEKKYKEKKYKDDDDPHTKSYESTKYQRGDDGQG